MKKQNLLVAITGASGAGYARKLLRSIPQESYVIHLMSSEAGRLVYELETGVALSEDLPAHVLIYEESDFTAPFASGSFPCAGQKTLLASMASFCRVARAARISR